jgi:hypothetical protein
MSYVAILEGHELALTSTRAIPLSPEDCHTGANLHLRTSFLILLYVLPAAIVQQAYFFSYPQRWFSLLLPFALGDGCLGYLGKYVQSGQVY